MLKNSWRYAKFSFDFLHKYFFKKFIAFVSLVSGRPTCICICIYEFVCVCIFSLFWDVTKRILVVTDVLGQPVGPIFKCEAAVREEHTHAHIHKQTSHVQYLRTYYRQPQHFICFVNWCYMFRSCGPPSGIKVHDFKNTGKNAWRLLKSAKPHKLCTLLALECKYFAHFSYVLLASIEETNKILS